MSSEGFFCLFCLDVGLENAHSTFSFSAYFRALLRPVFSVLRARARALGLHRLRNGEIDLCAPPPAAAHAAGSSIREEEHRGRRRHSVAVAVASEMARVLYA